MRRLLVLCVFATALSAADLPKVTYYRDVAGILQEHCQSCHRPGEIGPMSFGSYQEVRPWAKAIREAVLTRKMPPWFAEKNVGKFHNDPSLSQQDIDKLAAWAETGAAVGDPHDAPAPRTFVDGWNIGTPDAIFEMPEPYEVPASGTLEYTYLIVPTGFKEDRWLVGAEVRPGNRAVVHHAQIFIREPGSQWLRAYPVGRSFVPKEQIRTASTPRPAATTSAGAGALEQVIASYSPGKPAKNLPPGYGMLVPAGSDLVFQLHYTPSGAASPDRSRVGFVYAKSVVEKRVLHLSAFNDGFAIPPGAANYPVSGSAELGVDCELIDLHPHMHLRGQSMALAVQYPTGERDELLRVPKYDFGWQQTYELSEPKNLPKGTVLKADATFDNSANNRYNPDPKKEVRWGDQSWEEMMVGFFDVAVPVDTDPRKLIVRR